MLLSNAVGYAALATGDTSVALGTFNQASGARSVAIGYAANAIADDSVARGSGSVADVANTVSVCRVGSERQITNGPRTAGTDAVNKDQLDALASSTSVTSDSFQPTGGTDGSEDAFSLGADSTASGASSFAVGDESAAFGYSSAAYGANSVAIGSHSIANEQRCVVAGRRRRAPMV